MTIPITSKWVETTNGLNPSNGNVVQKAPIPEFSTPIKAPKQFSMKKDLKEIDLENALPDEVVPVNKSMNDPIFDNISLPIFKPKNSKRKREEPGFDWTIYTPYIIPAGMLVAYLINQSKETVEKENQNQTFSLA
jgi:hypothetical protein